MNIAIDGRAPLTVRTSGKATLALGSDPRDAFTPAAGAAEFETGEENAET